MFPSVDVLSDGPLYFYDDHRPERTKDQVFRHSFQDTIFCRLLRLETSMVFIVDGESYAYSQ